MTSRQSRAILGTMAIFLIGFVASTFQTWLECVTVIVLMLSILWLRSRVEVEPKEMKVSKSMPRWLRWALLFLGFLAVYAVCLAWRLGNYFGESINPILVGIDVVAHGSAILLMSIWVARPTRGHLSMLVLGMIVTLLCIAAGGTSQALPVQTAVALLACIGFALASQIILRDEPVRSLSDASRQRTSATSRAVPLFSLFTLSLMLMATTVLAKATSDVLPSIREGLQEQLKSSLDAVGEDRFIGGTRYVSGSNLGSVRRHMVRNPQEVALRVYAERAPGYLRGTVFDHFGGRHWKSLRNTDLDPTFQTQSIDNRVVHAQGLGRVQVESTLRNRLSRFQMRSKPVPTAHVEVINDPMKGSLVFMPLETRWLEASGNEIRVSHHGVIQDGVDITQPYVAGVGSGMERESLDEARRRLMLILPEVSGPVVRDFARSVCRPDSGARAKAAAISTMFQKDFEYSLSVTRAPRGVDPIKRFLTEKHPAHCEYFATATALMLRSVDVPTRYVTGYVADEYSEENLYWLARNRDAHAWVEAYDDETRTWFPVESTPGRTYLSINPAADATVDDDLAGSSSTSFYEDEDTLIGWVWGWLTSMRATDPLIVLFRFAQLPLFVVLVALLYARYWRRTRQVVDQDDMASRRMLRQVDRMSRKHNLVRQPSETLHQFADRIESGVAATDPPKQSDRLIGIARWYRQYAAARYRGQLPVSFQAN